MKIALVSPYDWSHPGGVRNHIRELAAYLRGAGHKVTVVTSASAPVDEAGVMVVGDAFTVPLNGSIARLNYPTPRLRQMAQLFLSARFDVVHIHEPLVAPLTIACTLGARAAAIPVVGTFHAAASPNAAWIYDLARPVLRPICAALTERIAVSPVALETIARVYPGHYHIIPNGLNLAPFQAAQRHPSPCADGRPTILFLGRLEPRKGATELLAALPRLRASLALAHLPLPHVVIAGDGPERDICQELAEKLGDITLAGTITDAEKIRLLAGATLFCAPALGGESQGIVLLEAMAVGTPVIASDIPGYRTVITPGTGMLVPPRDPSALASGLHRALADATWQRTVALEGRRAIQRYDWGTVGHEISSVYCQAIQQRGVAATFAESLPRGYNA